MNLHALSTAQIARLINREDEAVVGAVRAALPAITRFIRAAERHFDPEPNGTQSPERAPGRLIYLGAGTSGRLGVLDAAEAPPTFQIPHGRIVGIIAGGDGALRRSSEGKEDDPRGALSELRALRLSDADSVLGIAAGGTTPYVLGGLEIARRLAPGCVTGLLTCAPVKRPAACGHLLVLRTGPEALTGSTRMKAGSATKMALNLISTTLMVRSGRVHENLMVDMRATNAKLRDRAARIVATLTGLDRTSALEMLDLAGGAVKTAVVMHRLGATRTEAERRLALAGGRLARVRG